MYAIVEHCHSCGIHHALSTRHGLSFARCLQLYTVFQCNLSVRTWRRRIFKASCIDPWAELLPWCVLAALGKAEWLYCLRQILQDLSDVVLGSMKLPCKLEASLWYRNSLHVLDWEVKPRCLSNSYVPGQVISSFVYLLPLLFSLTDALRGARPRHLASWFPGRRIRGETRDGLVYWSTFPNWWPGIPLGSASRAQAAEALFACWHVEPRVCLQKSSAAKHIYWQVSWTTSISRLFCSFAKFLRSLSQMLCGIVQQCACWGDVVTPECIGPGKKHFGVLIFGFVRVAGVCSC